MTGTYRQQLPAKVLPAVQDYETYPPAPGDLFWIIDGEDAGFYFHLEEREFHGYRGYILTARNDQRRRATLSTRLWVSDARLFSEFERVESSFHILLDPEHSCYTSDYSYYVDLNECPLYTETAGLLSLLAYPDDVRKRYKAEEAYIYNAATVAESRAHAFPESGRKQFRIVDVRPKNKTETAELDITLKHFAIKLRERLAAAHIASSLTRGPGLPSSLNAAIDGFVSERKFFNDKNVSNFRKGIWQPSIPVLHLAIAFSEVLENEVCCNAHNFFSIQQLLSPILFFDEFLPELLEWATEAEQVICQIPSLGISASDLISVGVATDHLR